ncbi:MAG: hypothetical protein RBS36_12400 [Thiomicrospira sp.]|jgi:hypothetical protein|nr:hypothetical protein [Thiomicrospira sp.]
MKDYVERKISIYGIDDYRSLYLYLRSDFECYLDDVVLINSNRVGILERLREMCYALGLEPLGVHISDIQSMLVQGAHMTASAHLKDLKSVVQAELQWLNDFLSAL